MIEVGNHPLSIDELVRVARHDEAVTISSSALERLDVVRASIDAAVSAGTPVYGVSTGFGSLATTFISPEQRRDLQTSLIRSHAAGMGDPVEREVVRAMMLSRLTTLVSGVSGVRRHTAWTYTELLNRGVTPVVREFGSLGCSGDLAPLAHVALVLMGEGEASLSDGRVLPGAQALAEVDLEPVILAEKEGLALINGTDGMLGMLALALHDGALLQPSCAAHQRRALGAGTARHGPDLSRGIAGPSSAPRASDQRSSPLRTAREFTHCVVAHR